MVEVTVKPHFANTGGSASYGNGGVYVLVGADLSPMPDYGHGISFGANDITVGVGGNFGPADPVTFLFTPAEAKATLDGTRALFIYGYTEYGDGSAAKHRTCFAERISMIKGQPMYFFEVRTPAYRCQT
jgi:hypothetical protein